MRFSKQIRIVLSVVLVVLFCFSLAGCTLPSRFVGKWRATVSGVDEYKQTVLVFKSDGTGTLNDSTFRYSINSDDHTLRISSNSFTYEEYSYEFNGGRHLTISGSGAYYDINGTYEKTRK